MVCCGLLALAAGCVRALPGENPSEAARLYYPGRMALAADGTTAFVVNINFDQRFNTSWLTRVDVPALVRAARSNTPIDAALTQDVHVPALGGDLVFGPNGDHAYLTHRGSGLLTVLDVALDTSTLSCGAATDRETLTFAEAHSDCDRAHLIRLRDQVEALDGNQTSAALRQYDDPYALSVSRDGDSTALFVGYLGAGRISVLTHAPSEMPVVKGYVRTDAQGIARLARFGDGSLWGASRAGTSMMFDETAQSSLLVSADLPVAEGLLDEARLGQRGGVGARALAVSRALGGTTQDGRANIQGIALSPRDPNRLFVLSAAPDAVVALKVAPQPITRQNAEGAQDMEVTQSVALMDAESVAHSTLSDIVYVPRASRDLLAVTSLSRDAVYFFDPGFESLQLVHRLALPEGQGPVALLPAVVDGREVLLVSTFFDHGLTVIDISAPAPSSFTILASYHDASFAVAPRIR